MLLAWLWACTAPEPLPLLSLADLADEPVRIQVSYEHGEDSRGPHRGTITLSFDGLDCTGVDDDLNVRFAGQEPAVADRGPDSREDTEAGRVCTRDGLPSRTPTFTSRPFDRQLGEPLRIDLSQGSELATVVLPALPELPQITGVRAVGPEVLVDAADGFVDPGGRSVIYPGVSYQLELDRDWIPSTPTNGAYETIQRCFLGACVTLLDRTFDGSQLAYGSPVFALETTHSFSVECDTLDDPGCAEVTGLGPVYLAQPAAILDRRSHLHLAWSTLGEEGQVCRIDGTCDEGLECTFGICG